MLKSAGKKTVLKTIRHAKWRVFKQELKNKNYRKKVAIFLSITWQIYCAIMALCLIAIVLYKVITGEPITLTLTL